MRTKNFDETAVLDKALTLFRKQGYKVTTPAELVDYLGISRSSLYNTFGDKRSLYIKALQRYRMLTTNGLEKVVNDSKAALPSIKKMFSLVVEECLEEDMPRGCFLINSLVELDAHDSELAEIVNGSMGDTKNAFSTLVRRGQETGEINKLLNAEAMADYLTNCVSGISISTKAGADKLKCESIVKNSIAILG